jgi:hypothetical protein
MHTNDRSKSSIPTNRRRKIIFDEDDETDKENMSQNINVKLRAELPSTTLVSLMSNTSQDKTRPSSAASSTRHTARKEQEVKPKPVKEAKAKKDQPKKKEIARTDFKQRRKIQYTKTATDYKPTKALKVSSKRSIYIATIQFKDIDKVVSFPLYKDIDVLTKRQFDKHLIHQDLDNDVDTDNEMMNDALAHSKKNLKQGIKDRKSKRSM